MGQRGPKPAPKRTAAERGSWRARKRSEPVANAAHPECPDWLTGEARTEWERQTKILTVRGLWSSEFTAAIAMYCEAWGEYVEACIGLQDTGRTTTTSNGTEMPHPLVGIRNRAFDRCNRLGQQFGFSPTAVASVPPPPSQVTTKIPTRKRT